MSDPRIPPILTRLRELEADVAALQGVGAPITDHGSLSGLTDDDHSHYHNDTRGDARYYRKAQVEALIPSTLAQLDTSVTGAQLTADHAKLALIEPQATADQTAAEIRALYDSTRVFTTITSADSPYSASDGEYITANTSSGSITVILPASGTLSISREGTNHKLTIQGTVNGLVNPTIDYSGNAVTLAFITSSWRKI